MVFSAFLIFQNAFWCICFYILCYHKTASRCIHITWTWFYSFIWRLSWLSIIIQKSLLRLFLEQCHNSLRPSLPGSYNLTAITTETCLHNKSLYNQWVEQWWNSWIFSFLLSQSDTPRTDDFTGYKSGTRPPNKLETTILSSTVWLTEAFGTFSCSCQNYLYSNDDSFLQFCSCVDSAGQYYDGFMGITLIDDWACKEGLCIL